MWGEKAAAPPLRLLALTNHPSEENALSPLTGVFLEQIGQEISTVKVDSHSGLS